MLGPSPLPPALRTGFTPRKHGMASPASLGSTEQLCAPLMHHRPAVAGTSRHPVRGWGCSSTGKLTKRMIARAGAATAQVRSRTAMLVSGPQRAQGSLPLGGHEALAPKAVVAGQEAGSTGALSRTGEAKASLEHPQVLEAAVHSAGGLVHTLPVDVGYDKAAGPRKSRQWMQSHRRRPRAR